LRGEKKTAWTHVHTGKAGDGPDNYLASTLILNDLAAGCELRAEMANACGDSGTARACLEESLPLRRELGQLREAAYALHHLGQIAQHQGQWTAAGTHFRESLAFWEEDGNQAWIAGCLEGLGAVAAGQGEPERATRL